MRLLTTGIFCLIHTLLFAQAEEITPEKIKKAHIRAMTTTTFQITPEGAPEIIKTEKFTYNAEGKLVGRIDSGKGNTPETSTQIRYDEKGSKSFQMLVRHREKDTLTVTWQYKYAGDLIAEMHNSNTDIYKTYEYDPLGRLILEKDVSPEGKTIATHTWEYDDQGLLKEETETQQFLTRIYSWQYDAQGKKTTFYFTRTHTFEGETTTREKETYEYDNKGFLAKSVYFDVSGQMKSFTRFYYDTNGWLIKEETGDTEYLYKYDNKGNLTEKKKTIRGKVPGFVRNVYEFQ